MNSYDTTIKRDSPYMPVIIQHSSVAEYYSSEGSDSSSVTQLRYFNAYALELFQAEGLQISLTSSEGNDS